MDMTAPLCPGTNTCTWLQEWLATAPCYGHVVDATSERYTAWRSAHNSLSRQSWDDTFQVIRDYFVAAAAKDCAVMIALQNLNTLPPSLHDNSVACRACASTICEMEHVQRAESMESPCIGVVQSGGVSIVYSVGVIDLDLKPVGKLIKHYDLDRQILENLHQRCNIGT